MLPDSNVNEPASHGFIKFRIQQKASNPTGARIENTAAIYFDYNAPVLTNTTWHTIGNDFIISGVEKNSIFNYYKTNRYNCCSKSNATIRNYTVK